MGIVLFRPQSFFLFCCPGSCSQGCVGNGCQGCPGSGCQGWTYRSQRMGARRWRMGTGTGGAGRWRKGASKLSSRWMCAVG